MKTVFGFEWLLRSSCRIGRRSVGAGYALALAGAESKSKETNLYNTMKLKSLRSSKLIHLALILSAWVGRHSMADSITLSETWKDNTSGGVYSSSTDTGAFSASLTVSNLSSLTADNWSNLLVSINSSSLVVGEDSSGDLGGFSDFMADAPNFGGTVSATNAAFYFQLSDTNGNLVNAYKVTFSRSGNKLTIAGQTLNPAAVQPPWSIVAANYLNLDTSGLGGIFPIIDQTDCEVVLQDEVTSNQYADMVQTIYLSGTNIITYDSLSDELNNIRISGAADYTTPTLTAVSPTGTLTTTNDLLTVQVKATDSFGVANVEFYFNGLDYGSGVAGAANLWSLNFALQPGTNVIQTQATDVNGNSSPLDSLSVTYLDKQTNANSITFSEHWQDSSQSNSVNGQFDVSQDVGSLNAAWLVPGLQSLPASTWSNLLLTVSFGDVAFSNSLAAASVLTASNAVFYLNTIYDLNSNALTDVELFVARSGNTLKLAYETGNPLYDYDNPIIADNYLGYGGPVQDVEPFTLLLQDGNTLAAYANVSQTVYISGTDTVTYDSQSNELDNVQIVGAASFKPPVLAVVSPAAGAQLTNGLATVTVRATDNIFGAGYVEFYLNGQDFGPGILGNSNLWTMNFALAPGSNTVRLVATDYDGNNPATNSLPLVYVNRQTNANLITFEEHWLDSDVAPGYGYVISQDTGLLDAALKVPGLQSMPANTWSNLSLMLSFGDFSVSQSLLGANVLTTNKAVFYYINPNDTNATPDYIGQLTVSRAGNTLLIAAELGNPTYLSPGNLYFLAGNYLGLGGPIHDPQPFALTLQDGLASNVYASVSQPVFVVGTNLTSYDSNTNELNNIQISGTADFTPPTNVITAPVAGQRWSNAVFTVTGKARDNLAVSNVLWSVNGGVWSGAATANNWTNWTAQVTLTPGTNVISAYAVDPSGNLSPTNTVKFDYVQSAVLAVQIVGEGKVAPNLNGQLLALGQNYTLTATASNGFAFYYWSWGVSMTNKPALTFAMASNLLITANFKDVKSPTNLITFPGANQKWSNSVITVAGKAGDNVGVTAVGVQINNGGWTAAQTVNGFTNWLAAGLPVGFGTNIVQAYALDAAGNVSATNVVKFLGIVAPASLAGYAATLKPSVGKQEISVVWGDGTYSQAGVGSDTNANDYGAGVFDYVPTGPNTAVLTNLDVGMLSALGVTNITAWDLTFTSATAASYVWTNELDTASGSGTMTFLQVSNVVPASLAGVTLKLSTNNVLVVTTTFTNDVTFGEVEAGGVQHSGTYTLTQSSPTTAILQLNYTDPSQAGAVTYAELTFTSAAAGEVFESYYDPVNQGVGSNPDHAKVGTFKVAP
jgi:hypothetical protein